MYEEEYVLDGLLYLAGGFLSFWQTESFLAPKYARRKRAVVSWVILYAVFQLLYGQIAAIYPLYDRFTHIIPYTVILLLLQSCFFERNIPRQVLVIASFVAGWEILRFTVSPLAHVILAWWSPFWGEMVNDFMARGIWPADKLLEYMLGLNRIAIFAVLFLCRAIQLGLFGAYLQIIRQNIVSLNAELSGREIWYLTLPCVTVLTIDLTLRLMAYSADNSALMLIYNRVPETLVLLPLVSLLLLGVIISSVILFKGLYDFKDEEKKRLLLENRVADVHRQLEDLQGIYQDMRGLKHDLRAHIAGLTAFVRNHGLEKQTEIQNYLTSLTQTDGRLDFAAGTGNPITDIILHQAKSQANRRQISFTADFHYPKDRDFNVYDLSIILNNILSNAIEAAAKVPGERGIEIRAYEKGSLFFIEAENDFVGDLALGDNGLPLTTKADKHWHGLGLDNIRRAARKYLGDIEIETRRAGTRQVFCLTVMLYKSGSAT
ncbi:MAG: sensor histidine kinase [Selenomonadaceae bacterium]|nr:sensor histidine kinase [Selenomonadaceae bacterium]